MRTVCFLITIECPIETLDSEMDNLMEKLEEVVGKNNYELYDSEWYDE